MSDTHRLELAKAARLRLAAVPQRMAAVVATATVLHVGFSWPFVWLWVAAYAAATLLESGIGRLFADAVEAEKPAAKSPYVLSIIAVSLVYGALAVPLVLLEHGRDGEMYALILLAGGLVNVLIVSRASRAAFYAAAGTYGAYMMATPLMAAAVGVNGPSAVGLFGAGLLLAHGYTAWGRHRDALLAEAEARAESEARLRQAEAATAAKSAFVAMVSHELRTPLSGVLAAGAQLQGQVHEPGKRDAVDVVVDAGRFMHALLDDLLDLAKLEAGKMTTEVVDFDLGQLVWALERHWTAAARSAGKPLRLTSAVGLPTRVSGDPTRLRQVLNNLLSNAVKFTGEAGVTWTVDVCTGEGGCGLTVRVTDTGPGMSADKLDRLFTAFDQTDDSVARTHGGTGLGLALSRELARAMGGELRVESEVGRGSTFILSLPLGLAAAPEMRSAPGARDEPPGPPLRLLVVDDHEINRRTMVLLLQPSGAEVMAVEGARVALDLLRAEAFDAVLTDINMPEMNGLELARALRSGPGPNRATPVLAVTGGDSADELAACQEAGLAGCVAKPIEVGALYAALEAALAPHEDGLNAGEPRAA